jgi:prolyl-tRNA editing enzyme YbaK/EbsC (Cys-tRNA(Pro) deacylase)
MELPVEKLLKEKGVEYRLIKLSQKARTVDDVAKDPEGEVRLDEICKTIILRGKKSGKNIAVLLRGTDRINFAEAEKIFGEKAALANKEQVKEAAGVEPGAVCPFLLNVELFVDRRVAEIKKMNCGSGDHSYGLEMRTSDLAKAADCKIADLADIPAVH